MSALRNTFAIMILCGLTGCAGMMQRGALSLAYQAMQKGQYDRALTKLSHAEYHKTPTASMAAEVSFLRAQCYDRSGRAFEAAAAYSHTMQTFPNTLYAAQAEARLTALKHIPAGEIVAYGLYQVVPKEKAGKVAEAAAGERERAGQAVFMEQTNRVPARLGVRFGIGYILTGLPEDEDVLIRRVFLHPAMRTPDGQEQSSHATEVLRHSTKEGTVTTMAGYGFDDSYEMVAGVWKVEIWYCGRRLVEKTFTVVDPGTVVKAKGGSARSGGGVSP